MLCTRIGLAIRHSHVVICIYCVYGYFLDFFLRFIGLVEILPLMMNFFKGFSVEQIISIYGSFVFRLGKIYILIVSITKFLMVIGSPRAYLSRNQRAITWVSDYRCPIWKSSNRTPVIGYRRDFHVNYAHFNGFLSNVFYSFQNLEKALRTFSLKKKFLEDIFNSEICYRYD